MPYYLSRLSFAGEMFKNSHAIRALNEKGVTQVYLI